MTRRAKRGRASSARATRALPKRDRALAEHTRREARLKRYRTVVGFLGVVPLAGSLACDVGLATVCVPLSWYMAVWAAVFGAFVGLSIRLVRERRRFEAHQSRAS
jgi:hypothetical protein